MKKLIPILVILSFLPFPILTSYPDISELDSDTVTIWIGIIGSFIGILGLLLFWWQFVLGFRGVIGLFVKDWIYVQEVHKFIGKYGVAFIFLHPLLSAYAYGDQALDILIGIPDFSNDFEVHVAFGKLALTLLTIIWVSSALFRSKISFRVWRYIHYVGLVVVPLVFYHAWDIGSLLNANENLQYYWSFLAVTFVGAAVMRILFQIGFLGKHEYELVAINQVTRDVFEYRLKPKYKGFVVKPGQFIYIQPKILDEDHPFSVSNYIPETREIVFAAKIFGRFTKALTKLKIGQTVYIDGAYGVFTKEIETTTKPIIFIAGGIGVTPFLEAIENIPEKITMFYGDQTAEEIAYRDFVDKQLGGRVIHVLSDTEDKSDPTYEYGYITKELLVKYLGSDLDTYIFFVCGPPVMIGKVESFLKKEGVRDVHVEKFSL